MRGASNAIAAFDLCSVGSVSDFKEVSRYRLLGTGGFEQVAPDGELKHGKLSEQKYSNKADTYGQVVFLTPWGQITETSILSNV